MESASEKKGIIASLTYHDITDSFLSSSLQVWIISKLKNILYWGNIKQFDKDWWAWHSFILNTDSSGAMGQLLQKVWERKNSQWVWTSYSTQIVSLLIFFVFFWDDLKNKNLRAVWKSSKLLKMCHNLQIVSLQKFTTIAVRQSKAAMLRVQMLTNCHLYNTHREQEGLR